MTNRKHPDGWHATDEIFDQLEALASTASRGGLSEDAIAYEVWSIATQANAIGKQDCIRLRERLVKLADAWERFARIGKMDDGDRAMDQCADELRALLSGQTDEDS